jgi:hypothetical protein
MSFYNGWAQIQKKEQGDNYSNNYINQQGELLFSQSLRHANGFKEGVALVRYTNNEPWTYIDTTGREVKGFKNNL